MKNSLRLQIIDFLKEKRGQWVRKGEIERFGHSAGFNAYTACRRVQELTQPTHHNYNPDIEKHEFDGYVNYRYMPKSEAKDIYAPLGTPVYAKFNGRMYCCGNGMDGKNEHSRDCPQRQEVKQQQLI